MRTAARSAFLALVATSALAQSDGGASLQRYEAAAASHPDDPDLAWAHALALEGAGRADAALRRFAEIRARWPDRRARAAFEIGRILYALGRPADALEPLGEAHADPARAGAARMYHALCLLSLGATAAAEAELSALERSDAELASAALLVRGVARAELGDAELARRLLQRALDLDASATVSDAVRDALERLPDSRGAEPRFSTWGLVGQELDSNTTLEGAASLAGIPTDESDARAVWNVGLLWQPLRDERSRLSLGYAYGETAQHELESYDRRLHTLFGGWSLRAAGSELRIDALTRHEQLDDERYARSWLVRPSVSLARGWPGAARVFIELERSDYFDPPLLSSLERGGDTWSLGLESRAELEIPRGAESALELRLSRVRTEASRDLLGFEGDYDSDRIGGAGQLRLPLVWALDAGARLRLSSERFEHENLIDALTHDGAGTSDPSRRRDLAGELSLALGWTARPQLRFELRWTGTLQRSNVEVYDYRRQVLGIYAIAHHAWW